MDILKLLGVDVDLFITQFVGFLLLMGLLWKFGFKPLMAILEQRQTDIKSTYDQLDADRDAMLKTRQQYEQRLAGIEAEAREKIQAAIVEAQELREQMLADARQQAASLIERSRVESQRERDKAFLEMRQQIVNISISAAGKVIGEALDAQRHTKLVDDFIGMVGSGSVGEIRRNGTGAPSA